MIITPPIRAALLAGAGYLIIGRLFALPRSNVEAWRLAAWIASAIVFAAHLGYEYFNRRHSPRRMASNAALGVAMGGFGLAVAGALNSLSTTSAIRPVWLLALVLWPLITAVPAFIVALLAGMLLERFRGRKHEVPNERGGAR